MTTNNSSILVCCAHKGEAKALISTYNMKRTELPRLELYDCKEFSLLITGEGVLSSIQNLTELLSLTKFSFSVLYNLGFAGSLNSNLSIGEILPIGVSLAEKSTGDPEFQSYVSEDSNSTFYCISSRERVLSKDYAEKLGLHGELVDRELWGLAMVCKRFQLPFRSFKLVSDIAGSEALCQSVQENTDLYSERLQEFFDSNILKSSKQVPTQASQKPFKNRFLNDPQFHFSQAQTHQLEKFLQSLTRHSQASSQSFLDECSERLKHNKSLRPKDRSKELLLAIQEKLNPFQSRINKSLHEWFSKRPRWIRQISTDPQLESDRIKILLEVSDFSEAEDCAKYLTQLPFDEWQSLFKGETPRV